MSSIGIRDKNNCIIEFFPANEAYKMVATNGFRTFLKIINNDKEDILKTYNKKILYKKECIRYEYNL